MSYSHLVGICGADSLSLPPAAWMLFRHYLLSRLSQFRQLGSEWSPGAGVFLCVSHCIISGLAKAQHPGEALFPLILDMSPCQTDVGGCWRGGEEEEEEEEEEVEGGSHSTVVQCVRACGIRVSWLASPPFFFSFFFFFFCRRIVRHMHSHGYRYLTHTHECYTHTNAHRSTHRLASQPIWKQQTPQWPEAQWVGGCGGDPVTFPAQMHTHTHTHTHPLPGSVSCIAACLSPGRCGRGIRR